MYEGFYFLVAGIVARALIPWLVLLYKNRDNRQEFKWQWRFLYGQAVATVIVFIGLPLLLGDLAAVGQWGFQEAFLAGYGAAEIGRFLDKTVTE